ncbi:MAG TPA: radical SAM protein [Micromonosporaceae bacterium]
MALRVEDGRVVNPEGLEVNATHHCNMRCISCSHLAPLYRRSNVDPAALYDSLVTLADSYHASYVKILGGEPLLHPDLLGVIEAVRSSKISDSVLVCTNGTLLDRAPAAFWRSVDAVEISVYPSRELTENQLNAFRDTARAHGVDLIANRYRHFRVAYSEQGTDSESLIQDIFDTCKLAHFWLSHTVFDGWLYRCPQSVFLPEQLVADGWDRTVDGIRIEKGPRFRERLIEFLTRTTPLRACRNCLGSVGRLHPHAEVPRQEWRQPLPTEDVLDREFLALAKADISVDDGCEEPLLRESNGTSHE